MNDNEDRGQNQREERKGPPSPLQKPTAQKKQGAIKRKRRAKAPDAPKRPLSAYNLFFREERVRWLEERQGGSGKERSRALFALMGKEIAARWKQLTPEQTAKYQQMAEVHHQRFLREKEKFAAQQKGKAKGGAQSYSGGGNRLQGVESGVPTLDSQNDSTLSRFAANQSVELIGRDQFEGSQPESDAITDHLSLATRLPPQPIRLPSTITGSATGGNQMLELVAASRRFPQYDTLRMEFPTVQGQFQAASFHASGRQEEQQPPQDQVSAHAMAFRDLAVESCHGRRGNALENQATYLGACLPFSQRQINDSAVNLGGSSTQERNFLAQRLLQAPRQNSETNQTLYRLPHRPMNVEQEFFRDYLIRDELIRGPASYSGVLASFSGRPSLVLAELQRQRDLEVALRAPSLAASGMEAQLGASEYFARQQPPRGLSSLISDFPVTQATNESLLRAQQEAQARAFGSELSSLTLPNPPPYIQPSLNYNQTNSLARSLHQELQLQRLSRELQAPRSAEEELLRMLQRRQE